MGLWDVDKIEYVGRAKGPKEDFAFHYYDADKVVAGKKMKDWLRFGVAWWHTFNQELVDPFGTGTAHRPYYKYTDPMDQALAKVDYAFELFQKLGVEYFCFHDRDIAPEGDTLRETNANLDKVVDKIDENMKSTGVRRRHFSVRRHLRLRRWPAQEELGDRQAPGRRELRVLGWPRRLREPVEHRDEARDRPHRQVLPHVRRLRQGNRL